MQPSSTTTTTGSSVTLLCTVENKAGFVTWLKDGDVISNDTDVIDQALTRFSVMGTPSDGEFNLMIVLVAATDQGTYNCRVSETEDNPLIDSRDAVLTVIDQSTAGQTIEIPPSKSIFVEGTTATMVCYVARLSGTVLWIKDSLLLSRDQEAISDDRLVLFIFQASHLMSFIY